MPSSDNLGEQLESFISQAVRNGRYGSRSEVLREGVRMVQEREQRFEQLDQALSQGLADIEAGQIEDAGAGLRASDRAFGRGVRRAGRVRVRLTRSAE